MTREEKIQIVEELSQKFAAHNYFYITDASGLSVAKINRFRRLCYERGIEYRVVKNTLIGKALAKYTQNAGIDTDYSELDDTALKGFSGILFATDSGSAPAKLLKEYYKAEKQDRKAGYKPVLKAASVDQSIFIGVDQLDFLEKVKTKPELIADVVALLQSPAKNVLSALRSGGDKIAGLVKTLSEREAQS